MTEKLLRILYVEDEPDIQMVAKLSLESIGGFIVKACSSGDEAIQSAVEFEPQLILLDVMMPGMDGPTTLKRLREIPQIATIPVIFMTAKVQPEEIKQYKNLGAINVIAKPFDPMTLTAEIEESWEHYND
ncbi:MAG: response regulator [Nitrosomonas sp.]|nr:response regulator [Nitrosomonas sp.]